jgi:hypothetical protein
MTGESSAQTVFDWDVRDALVPGVDIVPVPHPGADWGAGWSGYHTLYNTLLAQGKPLGLMLHDSTGSVGGKKDPNALATVMGYAARLDYVMADFEDSYADANTLAMVGQVRASSNPAIRSARIGSYAYYPGAVDLSMPYGYMGMPMGDRSAADAFYRSSGLNIAMPAAYPYAFYSVHADRSQWGTNVAPNVRSALFWAPLEKVSTAARALPSGDLLMPFVEACQPWGGYPADPPTREDDIALVTHLRLRGADDLYICNYGPQMPPGYSSEQYKADVLTAWHDLDWLFANGAKPTVLNLSTDKVSGVQWSGMQNGNGVCFEISNLGDVAARINLPDIAGIPDWSPMVQPGQHLELVYAVPEPGALMLLAIGLVGLMAYAWRKQEQQRCRAVEHRYVKCSTGFSTGEVMK